MRYSENERHARTCTAGNGLWVRIISTPRKKGIWLNNPRLYHEASGTSGMTAAMNASVKNSIPMDGFLNSPNTARIRLSLKRPRFSTKRLKIKRKQAILLRFSKNEIYSAVLRQACSMEQRLFKQAWRCVATNLIRGAWLDEYFYETLQIEISWGLSRSRTRFSCGQSAMVLLLPIRWGFLVTVCRDVP